MLGLVDWCSFTIGSYLPGEESRELQNRYILQVDTYLQPTILATVDQLIEHALQALRDTLPNEDRLTRKACSLKHLFC